MRIRTTIAVLAAAIVLALVGATSSAQAVTRIVTTACPYGKIVAIKKIDSTAWTTPTSCSYTTYENGKFVPHNRPQTDREGAVQGANHFWPVCFRSGPWQVIYNGAGYYDWYFEISC